jgi:hypothetical protein
MNIVFLSPHFPPDWYHFVKAALSQGHRAYVITDEPQEYLHETIRTRIAGHYQVSNLHNWDEVMTACEFFAQDCGKIHLVESHNEAWLEVEAAIRERFQVPGLLPKDVEAVKYKSRMKEYFKAAKLSVAPGEVVATVEDVKSFGDKYGYPFILKPDKGVGAYGTLKVESKEQTKDLQPVLDTASYFAESFIDGLIETYDGFVDETGNVVFETSHCYSDDPRLIVSQKRDFYFYSRLEPTQDLFKAGRAAIASFPISSKFFHIEFMREKDGSLKALEFNMRPPGGVTMDMFNYATDSDLYAAWVSCCLSKQDVKVKPKHHTAFLNRRDRAGYHYTKEEILERLRPGIVYYERMPGAFADAMGETAIIFRSGHPDDVEKAAEFIHQRA